MIEINTPLDDDGFKKAFAKNLVKDGKLDRPLVEKLARLMAGNDEIRFKQCIDDIENEMVNEIKKQKE